MVALQPLQKNQRTIRGPEDVDIDTNPESGTELPSEPEDAGPSKNAPRDNYSIVEFLWMPALGGIAVTGLALYKLSVVKRFAEDNQVSILLPLVLFFVLGAVGSLPLMFYDSIGRPWLRNLVLWTGVLVIVMIVIGFTLMTRP